MNSKKFSEGMKKLQAQHKEWKKKKRKLSTPTSPKHDDVYQQGVKWLNSL